MIDETLAHNDSHIHRLDPCARVVLAVILSFSAALSENFIILALYFLLSVVLVFMASIDFVNVMKRVKPLFWFIVMIWIILPLTFEGEVFSKIGPFVFTKPGIALCAKISIKSVTILLIFTSLLATMTVASLGNGLHRLYLPDKTVFLLLMTYRYIFVIECEYNRLLRAASLRGFNSGTNLHSYKTYAYLAGMLFVRASCRAKRVHQAMVCRGFNGRFHTLDTFADSHIINFIFMAGVSAITSLLVVTELFWI